MAIFDDVLLCTDWDGTFAHDGKPVPENLDAVRYFQENGGLFTVCSGRFPDFLLMNGSLVRFDTCLLSLNGSLIVDPVTGEEFSSQSIDSSILPIVGSILEAIPGNAFINLYPLGVPFSIHTYPKSEFLASAEELLKKPTYKILIHLDTPEEGQFAYEAAVKAVENTPYEAARSWSVGLELILKSGNKGSAVLFAKEKARRKYLVCCGDYENDLSMLRASDFACSPRNAIPSIQAASDFVSPLSNREGAFRDFIREIESRFGK